MTRITPEALYALLPAVHRLRDAAEGYPLRALVAVLAREGAVIEENIEQLYDDQFIETCDDWAAPYIGGIVGYRPLHPVAGLTTGPRAEVANTIGYRRRKGTAAVLEQLARDVTGWPARVVEFFQLVATCQHMNHIRPDHAWAPDLGDPLALEPLGRAFDAVTRTVDVRSIARTPGRRGVGGRHNLPNVGIFLWRLMSMPLENAPTTRRDDRRYLFDPLGAPRQLVNRSEAEETITSLAEPLNVPGAITRRALHADPGLWYPRAFEITVGGTPIPASGIEACDLSDDGAGWNHVPPLDPANALVRVDPELGRIAFPEDETREVRTTFRTAFPAPIGGGAYDRAAGLAPPTAERPLVAFPHPIHATLEAALAALPATGGIVEITTNDVIDAPATIDAAADAAIELRADEGFRPVLRAAAPLRLSGGPDARITIDGLVLEGAPIEIVANADGDSLGSVRLAHLTLIPGLAFTAAGGPDQPGATSLEVTATGVELAIDRSIVGPLRMVDSTNAEIRDSIVDAAAAATIDSAEGLAIAGTLGEGDPAGALTIVASTVIGRVFARSLPLVSDTILFARDPAGGAPVRAMRRQDGCLRFSFVPEGSLTPRRYRCQPQLAIDQAVAAREAETGTPVSVFERALIAGRIARWLVPGFTALAATAPAYCQLAQSAPREIREGASDESEMGVYHQLFQPQRVANLEIRLEEYLRFGLEAGTFFET